MLEALEKRIITAFILIAALLLVWYLGGFAFNIAVILISSCALWEFICFFYPNINEKRIRHSGIILNIIFCSLALFTPINFSLAFIFIGMLVALYILGNTNENGKKALEQGAILLLGIIYIPFLLILGTTLTPAEQLTVIFLPIVNDTSAYFFGLTFGKHKIWPQVSPKKSVEGSVAGFIFSIIFMTIIGSWLGLGQWWEYAFIGGILSIFAQLGDFFESALKRVCDVKDSSQLLPGHGGVLDRIDSILFSIPTYLILSSLLPHIRF